MWHFAGGLDASLSPALILRRAAAEYSSVDESTRAAAGPIDYSLSLQVFFLLQVLDFITTLLGFEKGLVEASPFVQLLMRQGTVIGLLSSKIIAIALGALCVWRARFQAFRLINYWYAGLVIWNLTLIVTR
jgi:hypothetical protein